MANSRLTLPKCKALQKPGTHGDGGGLYLLVRRTGAKSWIQRITIRGKRRELGLGGFPAVSLAKARALAAVAVPVRLQPVDLLLGGDAPVEYL